MALLYAQPYDLHAAGFYFDSLESYEKKAARNRNEFGDPVEEYEIQFIDGDNYALFGAAGICQASLDEWFKHLDHFDGDSHEGKALLFLLGDRGMDLEEALEKYTDVSIFEGTALDYAHEFIDDCYNLEGIAAQYFDYERFARDLVMGGDIEEIEHNLLVTNPHDF